MIIKITYPSRITPSFLRKKTREFQRNMVPGCTGLPCLDTNQRKAQILLKKRNILINFDATDKTAIAVLRNYVSFVFNDILIGVDQYNPITSNLENVTVFSFAERKAQ